MDISNRDDVIDSRQIIERIEELAELMEENESDPDTYSSADHDTWKEELSVLAELAIEGAAASSEWDDGETLIRDDYFEDFARELVDDCGYFSVPMVRDSLAGSGTPHLDWSAWPYRCIDWARVADELKADYTTIQFDGVDYWIRSV